MKDSTTRLNRRHFLFAVGAGAAASAAAVAVKSSQQEPNAGIADDKRRGKGYSESQHVRRYYRTTRV